MAVNASDGIPQDLRFFVPLANRWGWVIDTSSCTTHTGNDSIDYFLFFLCHGDIVKKVFFRDGQVFTDINYDLKFDLCDPECFDKLEKELNNVRY